MLGKKYVSIYENALSENRFLKLLIFAFMIVIIAEAGLMVVLSKRVRILVVPAVVNRKFFVEGEKASPEYIELMAEYAVDLLKSFTPKTVKVRRHDFLKLVSPQFYHTIETKLMTEADEYITYDVSSFFIRQQTQIKDDKVIIHGILKKFMGKKALPQKHMVCIVYFRIHQGRFEVTGYEEMDEDTYRNKFLRALTGS
ncbi:MAG TPA: hypothetical protein ENG51_10435 [Deltaproteobacteria bacterium]|nr:hypothetical protein [Deltaproteobacteria bacterium]